MSKKVSIFWFRRDLRLDDNVGFLEALKGDYPVLPLFIFDKDILDKLPENDVRKTIPPGGRRAISAVIIAPVITYILVALIFSSFDSSDFLREMISL